MILKLLLISQLCLASAFNIIPKTIPLRTNNNKAMSGICMIDRRDVVSKGIYALSIPLVTNLKSVNAFSKDEVNQIDLYEKTVHSVCYISTEYKNISKKNEIGKMPQGVGTGFVWDTNGHVVTNFHVINSVKNATVTLKDKNNEEKEYLVKVTGVDPDKDIAVLKIDVNQNDNIDLVPIELSSNKDIKIGQNVFALGNPFGQDFSFSMGIVSGLHRKNTAPSGRKITEMIQTDAAINPGNSGGPLIDTEGKLVGMSTSTMGMGVSSGVNFAISVDTIKNTVNEIINNNGVINKAVLGISYLERRPNKAEAADANIPYIEKGIIVLDVPVTSPAYAEGLLGIKNMPNNVLGDVIIGIDDYVINEATDLLEALDHYKPDDRIKLKILRGVEQIPVTLNVALGSFKSQPFSSLEYEK